MAEENNARVYGMADQANRHPPAAQGMRGEKSTGTQGAGPEFSHDVTLESGRRVVVSEGNGVAFAEASGRIPSAEGRDELEVEFIPEGEFAEPARPSQTPLLIGALLAGAGLALYVTDRWLRSRTDRETDVRFGDLSASKQSRELVPVQDLPHRQQVSSSLRGA
ncbi:hypothetical protein [Sphingomonas sp.]|jgi:hypothetical protein|uniref:hypothetical protein n=1 Tax=Sphingomonas sp. TaxID=28214 RepID=UPI002DEE857A|nr:hypothetical protein [Sphingomonas sp.]